MPRHPNFASPGHSGTSGPAWQPGETAPARPLEKRVEHAKSGPRTQKRVEPVETSPA
jgi:hypothetical protein